MPTSARTMSGRSRWTESIAACPFPTAMTLYVLVRERQFDDALDRDAVIGKQQLVRHPYHDTLSGHPRMVSLRSSARAVLVTLVDAALIVSASAAVVILLGGRTRIEVAGVRVSLRAATNSFIFTAAFAALRLWLGRGMRPLPAVPQADGARIEAERERFAAPPAATRAVWIYAAATLPGIPGLDHPASAASAHGPGCRRSDLLRVANRPAHAPARDRIRGTCSTAIFSIRCR